MIVDRVYTPGLAQVAPMIGDQDVREVAVARGTGYRSNVAASVMEQGLHGPSTPGTPGVTRHGKIRIVADREVNKWAADHLPGAILLPPGERASRANEGVWDNPVDQP